MEGGDLDHLLIKTNNELLIPEIAIFSEEQILVFTLDYLDLNRLEKIMTHKESKCKHAETVMDVVKRSGDLSLSEKAPVACRHHALLLSV